ncbi:class I SAM-dependent methyltransferase [Paenibacillus sp. S3N08]|uniref:Class I SAM-dependent methyltransferase n=1 Tax=Paenibacillus agricola TaxID=2716264 RepID=A0ABX0J7K1_9BACL|nr:class I SAM-dependent methyltransferase [Paenibacillus agricola]
MVYQAGSVALIVAVLLALLSIVYTSWRNGISPMPSSFHVRRTVVAEIKRFSGNGTIVEGGSGWGTLALDVAKHCPRWRIIGLENSIIPLGVSRLASRWASRGRAAPDNVAFIKEDLYKYPYDQADMVVCYLYPGAMKRLSGIFGERLVPGTPIISVCFALPGWQPERVITCRDLYRTKVYVYVHKQQVP